MGLGKEGLIQQLDVLNGWPLKDGDSRGAWVLLSTPAYKNEAAEKNIDGEVVRKQRDLCYPSDTVS